MWFTAHRVDVNLVRQAQTTKIFKMIPHQKSFLQYAGLIKSLPSTTDIRLSPIQIADVIKGYNVLMLWSENTLTSSAHNYDSVIAEHCLEFLRVHRFKNNQHRADAKMQDLCKICERYAWGLHLDRLL